MHNLLPKTFLESLQGTPGFDRDVFEKLHESGDQVTSIRINPLKFLPDSSNAFAIQRFIDKPVPWSAYGFYLSQRPSFTLDPLFHAGCYYVQEASSMFIEQALQQTTDLSKPIRVLDLCAAPGGKSTHLLSLLPQDSLLVSNEVIRSRVLVLNDQVIKWGHCGVLVTSNDPAEFGKTENYFDVIIADAPCSGSGLFRRDPDAIREWSENNVQLCSRRQQRILADVLPALKPGGILIYSTCSYSREEDEEIVSWLSSHFPLAPCPVSIKKEWGITETENGLRFWPDKVKGEGFFISCFKKGNSSATDHSRKKIKMQLITGRDYQLLKKWVRTDGLEFISVQKQVHAIPETLVHEMCWLIQQLRIVNAGTIIGEIIRDKLVPHHALAMSLIYGDEIEKSELDEESAVQYLRKKEFSANTNSKGWRLVTFHGQPLGWINVLSGRINNYYPKELRILKD